jgi:hypothetical protein
LPVAVVIGWRLGRRPRRGAAPRRIGAPQTGARRRMSWVDVVCSARFDSRSASLPIRHHAFSGARRVQGPLRTRGRRFAARFTRAGTQSGEARQENPHDAAGSLAVRGGTRVVTTG